MRFLSGRLEKIADSIPTDLQKLQEWRRRLATLAGALLVGLIAIAFAWAGDFAQTQFSRIQKAEPYSPLILTPALFVIIAAVTRSVAPEARGSGIPQAIAASRDPEGLTARGLLSLRAGLAKLTLTVGAMFGGASVGREGPTVQVGAAVMVQIHRLFGVRVTPGVVIAGGAAGVAAAFNTPLAGIAFAIEELAVAYEQRVAIIVMGAVMIAGLTSQGIAGDYVYFGQLTTSGLPLTVLIVVAPLTGLLGGLAGGFFSRLFLACNGGKGAWRPILKKNPLLTALVCGLIVAAIGIATNGATWGTGYEPTRALLEGDDGDLWFGPAKFIATIATSASGVPGGIFAPALAVGAGLGNLLTPFFPAEHAGTVIILGMAAYFVGVVRAPLTAVIILSETTGTTDVILPLFVTCLIGDWAGGLVCKHRLYHALAADFMPGGDKSLRPGKRLEETTEIDKEED
ncbi:chloride channel protein [Altericroceibacterium spongiae]|uniref:Chloride channel protein n=1 Tax=Altericroceibacterium spongiae TaxID=2320269 RepID=A0A420EKF2_9SPHN|nr:chloride channel protein [Altericroceibacterium spongiae]RKF21153.1 chloride channel protein [Altericroceibacterium spongiae]